MAKKYVPAGVFLTCDKGTLPATLNVTFNAFTSIYGQNLATDKDMIPLVNIPPMGVCSVTKMPCVFLPSTPWSPVKNDVQLGMGHPLLEDSKLQCSASGRIGIHFTMAAAQAACAPPPAPEKSLADQADDYLKTLGPLGAYGRFQLGVAEGVWEGGKGLAEGLWGMAKGGWNAVTHPVDTANAIAEGATSAYKWAGDSQNWSNAAHSAGQGISNAADWASHGENWQKVGDKLQNMSPRDWGNVTGQVAFEVGLTVATAGAGTALNAAAKTSRVARMALRAARIADVEGHAMSLASRAARSAAGRMKTLGKVLTGAKKARKAEKAAAKAGKKAKQLAAVTDCAGPKKCTRVGHPVDVAAGLVFTEAVDFELPGPIPFVWERIWYSRSTHQGALGHGWHHRYDLALAVEEDGSLALRLADGRLALFAPPAGKAGSFNRPEKLEAFGPADQGYRIWNKDERLWYVFAPEAVNEVYLLQAVEDNNGFAIRFAYTPQGFLSSITDSVGRQLRADTDPLGRLTALHAPLPEPGAEGSFVIVRYEYSEAGDMVRTTDALGHAMTFVYEHHLLVRETNRLGLSFYFRYDSTGPEARCLRTWGDGGIYDTTLRYESAEHTVVTDSVGYTKHYTHRHGLVVVMLDSLGAVRQWTYNEDTDLTLERDPLGQATSYEYDARGNQTLVTYPDGAKIQTQYNPQDLPIQAIDANEQVWQWTYDEAGNLLRRINPVGASTEYSYDAQGRLVGVADNLAQTLRLRYDAHYNIGEVLAPNGQVSSNQYDFLGRVIRTSDFRGNVRQYQYDILGRILWLREPDGAERTFTYDAVGSVLREQDPHSTTQYTYTSTGLLAARDQAGARVSFTYDTEGRLTSLCNEHGEVYTLVLDVAGQVVEEVGFDGLTRRYYRDLAGRVTTLQRPAGRSTQYAYDAVGRLTEVLHHDGTQAQFVYRPDGELVEANTPQHSVRLDKNALGQVVREVQGQHVVESDYDILGQRLGLRSSLGAAAQMQRSLSGQLEYVRTDQWQAKFTYNAFGQEIERVLESLQLSWQHDVLGRPARQTIHTERATKSHQRRYHWLTPSRLSEIDATAIGRTSFTHDEQDNLVSTRYADGVQEIRQPDAIGNLFRTPSRTDRQYGKGGQLREANGTRYYYDAEGNLVRKRLSNGQQWHYDWDGAGQLTSVTRPDGYAVTFTYDALGRRLSKRFRGRVTRWVWDGNQPLHEWQELEVGPGAGSVQDLTTWLFEDASFAPMAKLTAQAAYSVLVDHLGTPLELYDQQGTKTWQAQLDSYGQVREGKGKPQDCPFRYQGQYEDVETGLYYNRFRYYDPEAGRYISQDPIGVLGGMNLYSYVADPTTWIDPFGWYSDLNHDGMGHHLFPRSVAGKLQLPKLDKPGSIAWYPDDPTGTADLHKRLHRALIDEGVPFHGSKYTGSVDDFFDKGKKAYAGFPEKGFLKLPGTNQILYRNLTPGEALEKLQELHKAGKIPCPK
ncbi:RHS repeat-associated core domain-containing protein [Hymenobacter chitinivorans]|uniref:RHS repeat-associated protein n=1 Tax=Hymenobacter chitinivorans DSM 11115 TaxID=1121954 RepID=A0A2M9BN55_9BACT|nr:RHS repeat-associated core domain-containing protein [Hymenobacter chitinivorans]PJJ59362.1 RHS repeat-associated protein [Hymenobacter chitinivorans DSM 11115]